MTDHWLGLAKSNPTDVISCLKGRGLVNSATPPLTYIVRSPGGGQVHLSELQTYYASYLPRWYISVTYTDVMVKCYLIWWVGLATHYKSHLIANTSDHICFTEREKIEVLQMERGKDNTTEASWISVPKNLWSRLFCSVFTHRGWRQWGCPPRSRCEHRSNTH